MFRGDRLKKLRNTKSISQLELGRLVNKTHAAINRHENNINEPDVDTINLYAKIFNVSTDYLTGLSDTKIFELPPGASKINGLIKLPILGIIRAGKPIYTAEHIIGYEEVAMNNLPDGELFFLRVTGDSMNLSRINDGDILLIRRQEDIENGQIAVIIINGFDATVKKFYNNHNGTITLMPHSTNPEHLPMIIDLSKENVIILGRVIQNIIKF